MTTNQITIFKSMNSHDTPEYYDIQDIFARIKRGNNRSLITRIRAETDKAERDKLKKQLLWILFSGKFRARLNDQMIAHSGYICLDFDGMEPADLRKWRAILTGNKHTFGLFTSPSGNGLKVIWKIPVCTSNDEHNRRFDAIAKTFEHCQFFDKNVKGWNRVCFESYDPELFVNPKAEVFSEIIGEFKPAPVIAPGVPVTDSEIVLNNLIKWFERTNSLSRGNRDAGAFCFACAVADYIPETEGWQLAYNYIASNVEQVAGDMFTDEEIRKCVNQAYRKTPHPTKKMNVSGDDLPNIDDSLTELIPGSEVILEKKTKFWKKNKNGGYEIDYLAFKYFLQLHGYFRHDLNKKDFEFIHVNQQTIEPLGIQHVKDFVLEYLERWGEAGVYNMMAGNSKFKKEYLNLLDNKKIVWNRDTKYQGWIYFDDCAVRVTANEIEVCKYVDIDGYIWASQKNDRRFEIMAGECDASKFISNICGGDQDRIRSYRSAMGYLMHSYKSYSVMPAIIFTDEIISNEPSGGSGKGLTLKMIGQIRKTEIIDGKSFNAGKNFVWQRVGPDTKIIQIDDIPKNFDFEKMFSILTEGIPVEKKNMDEIYVSFQDSPKFVINTNTVLKGSSDSHERRKFEIELSNYYNARHQPVDDFGRDFFVDWPETEWMLFDNYMIGCLQIYLKHGLIKAEGGNMRIKKLVRETCQEFVEFAKEELANNKQYHKLKMCEAFKSEQGQRGDWPSKTIFTRWMKIWGEYNGWEVKDGGGGRNYIIYGNGIELEGDSPF